MPSSTFLPRLGVIGHDARTTTGLSMVGHNLPNYHKVTLLLHGDGGGTVGPITLSNKRPLIWFTVANTPEVVEFHGRVEYWCYSFIWEGFTAELLPDNKLRLRCFDKTQHTTPMKPMDHGDASRMVEHFKSLQRSNTRWEMSGECETQSFLYLLLAFFIDLPDQLTHNEGHRALQQFRMSLDDRAFDDVSIAELSKEVNMSPEHMRSLFYQRFGVHPHAYRSAIRMAKARQLLSEPNVSVKEVAHLVGYPDPLYFSRVFKQRYGMNPSEMIRKFRE